MRDEIFQVVRHWYDNKWYVDDVQSSNGDHNYWLGCIGHNIKKHLFGCNRPVPMVEDTSFMMKYFKSYIRKYCDNSIRPPAIP